jgi:hypothetical protein
MRTRLRRTFLRHLASVVALPGVVTILVAGLAELPGSPVRRALGTMAVSALVLVFAGVLVAVALAVF